jgi:hypothetical protein
MCFTYFIGFILINIVLLLDNGEKKVCTSDSGQKKVGASAMTDETLISESKPNILKKLSMF